MNNLDKQYTDLLQDILDNGINKGDRTGTGTISVFGRTIRHKMSEGFPILTTKKIPFKTMATELVWFLRGDTNIQWLVQNGCNIWNGDAYKKYYNEECIPPHDHTHSKAEFIELIKTNDEFAKKWGELGPIYGAQWRSWGGYMKTATKGILVQKEDGWYVRWSDMGGFGQGVDWLETKLEKHEQSNTALVEGETVDFDFTLTRYNIETFEPFREAYLITKGGKYTGGVDQIANLIHDLKTNPDSRRLMVNAWNVGHISSMTLPPCHYGFQVYTRKLSNKELETYMIENYPKLYVKMSVILRSDMTISLMEVIEKHNEGLAPATEDSATEQPIIPTRAISLMWNQRSVDTFLGLPFNIASYGLLLEILAKEVNMIPDELIGQLGDTHLYSNHIEQAKEQIGHDLTDLELSNIMMELSPEIYGKYLRATNLKWEAVKEQRYEEASILRDEERECMKELKKLGLPSRTRVPFPLPDLMIEDTPLASKEDCLPYYQPDDFELVGYKCHPTIKAPLSN